MALSPKTSLDALARKVYSNARPDPGTERQWIATSMRYQGKWLCPSGLQTPSTLPWATLRPARFALPCVIGRVDFTSPSQTDFRPGKPAVWASSQFRRVGATHQPQSFAERWVAPTLQGSPPLLWDEAAVQGFWLHAGFKPASSGSFTELIEAPEPKEYRPMTVRWKPLLIMSGLFLAVALVGVVAITVTLVPRSAQGILKRARAARQSQRFADAEIYYKQVLQLEAKNGDIHEEFAGMYLDWSRSAAAAKQPQLRGERLDHLMSAVKFNTSGTRARRELLADAMNEDVIPDSLYWAKEILKLEPADADAHFVLGVDALEGRTPNLPEAQRHLKVLEEKKAPLVRRLWIRAKLADATGDLAARSEAFAQAAAIRVAADCPPIDRTTWLRIITLQIRSETDPVRSIALVQTLLQQAKPFTEARVLSPARVARLRSFLERAQHAFLSGRRRSLDRLELNSTVRSKAIELDLEAIFKLALSGEHEPDLQTFWTYADHLRVRRRRDRCLAVVDQALKSPQASRRNGTHAVMGLHTVAVEMGVSPRRTTRHGSTRPPRTSRRCSNQTSPDSKGSATSLRDRSSLTNRASQVERRAKTCRPAPIRKMGRSCVPARSPI